MQQFRALDRLEESKYIEQGIADNSMRAIRINFVQVLESISVHEMEEEPDDGACISARTTLQKCNMQVAKVQTVARAKKHTETLETKETQDTARKARSGFISDPSFEEKCASKLQSIILRELKINKDTRAWPRVFAQMQQYGQISQTRIQEALVWYGKHYGENLFVPFIEDAKEFRTKFGKLERAMKDIGAKPKHVKPSEITDEARSILERVDSLSWPRGSKVDLPQLVDSSLQAFKKFQEHRTEKVQWWRDNKPEEREDLIHFDNKLHECLLADATKMTTDAESFIVRWCHRVNAILQNWEGWRGKLMHYCFRVDHEEFQKMIIESVPDAHLHADDYISRMKK